MTDNKTNERASRTKLIGMYKILQGWGKMIGCSDAQNRIRVLRGEEANEWRLPKERQNSSMEDFRKVLVHYDSLNRRSYTKECLLYELRSLSEGYGSLEQRNDARKLYSEIEHETVAPSPIEGKSIAREISEAEWTNYKRAKLNPTPSFADKLYSKAYSLKK